MFHFGTSRNMLISWQTSPLSTMAVQFSHFVECLDWLMRRSTFRAHTEVNLQKTTEGHAKCHHHPCRSSTPPFPTPLSPLTLSPNMNLKTHFQSFPLLVSYLNRTASLIGHIDKSTTVDVLPIVWWLVKKVSAVLKGEKTHSLHLYIIYGKYEFGSYYWKSVRRQYALHKSANQPVNGEFYIHSRFYFPCPEWWLFLRRTRSKKIHFLMLFCGTNNYN